MYNSDGLNYKFHYKKSQKDQVTQSPDSKLANFSGLE